MAGISATYISATSFSITGDQTSIFNEGRRVRSTCSSIYKYGTVESSTYSSLTTVVLTATSDALNSGLTEVYYGIAADSIGSLPTHLHDTTEGEGGTLTFISLSDTPATYDNGKYLKSTTSGIEWATVSGGTGTSVHSELSNLDYASAGHTGFSPTSHTHTESDVTDLDKYTQSEVGTISGSLNTKIDGKADTIHTHDDRYYTESEVDTISGTLQNDIDTHGHVSTEITMSKINTPTYETLQDWLNNTQSAGRMSGGDTTPHIDAVTGVTVSGAGYGEFKVSGDQTTGYIVSDTIHITGSTNNNGYYTVASGVVYSGGTTTIPVEEAVEVVADGNITNGTVDVAEGTAFIKQTDSDIAETVSFNIHSTTNIALTDITTNYVYVDYNGGNPDIKVTTDEDYIEKNMQFPLAMVYKNDGRVWVCACGIYLPNRTRLDHDRILALRGYERASGGEISEYGTRNIQSTAGEFYRGTTQIDTTAKTSVDDKLTTIYYDGSAWVWTENETQIDNTYYNNIASGLVELGVSKYAVHWVCIDYLSNLYVVYGRGSYSLAEAQLAGVPSFMPVVAYEFGIIAAKIIIQKSASSFDELLSAYTQVIPTATPAVHNNLSGLNDGDYKHLTAVNHTDLTDSGDCSIHKHDDRYYTESEVDTISGSLQTNIDGKSDTGHTHVEANITDLDKYTQAEIDTISGTLYDSAVKYVDTPTRVTVNDGETIQDVIDGCPVAVGTLKDGFTNPYVVKVPPGHEKEFYSLVRNVSDAASDKRNVKIIFENNPDNKFELFLIDNCEVTTDWTSDCSLSIDADHKFTGSGCITFDNIDTSSLLIHNDINIDLSMYNGFAVDIEFEKGVFNNIKSFIRDTSGNFSYSDNIDATDIQKTRTTIFVPFDRNDWPVGFDISNIKDIGFSIANHSGKTGTYYIDNIRAVKTFQTPVILLRIHQAIVPLLAEKFSDYGYKASSSIIPSWAGESSINTYEDIRKQIAFGHCTMQNSVSHVDMTDFTRAQSSYELHAANNWLYFLGVKKGFGWVTHPYWRFNEYGIDYIEQVGGSSCDPGNSFLPFDNSTGMFSISTGNYTVLENILSKKNGGLQIIWMTDVTVEADLDTFFTFIDEHFSHVITYAELPEYYPLGWPNQFNPSRKYVDPCMVKTLTGNEKIEIWQGGTFAFDPGGANRNITPFSNGIPYVPSHEVVIVNTADAAETMTFDPTFTAAGAHDGDANASILTDSGESWVSGQLVGRTLSNTTDGSSGIITTNDGTTITAILSGGTDNDWDIGDTYTITPVGLNQAIAQNERGIFTYDGAGWLKINNEIPTTLLELDDTPSSYDNNKYLKSTTSGIEWATVSGGTGTSVHSELSNLDYASAGHTGFQPSGDYATDSELASVSGVLQTNIDGKADTSHLHDDRYYTESEVDTISGSLNTKIDTKADSGANSDITSMTGLDDDGIPGAKVVAASSTAEGVSELAIASEVNTGTDATRTITPDALAGSNLGTKNVVVKCIADDTTLTTGNGKAYFTVPIELNGMNLASVGAHVYTVSSSGLPTFQIHNLTDTVDMLSTEITIDATEKDSKDATTPAVIDTANDDVATGDELRFDCDVAGTGTKGFEIRTGFRLP